MKRNRFLSLIALSPFAASANIDSPASREKNGFAVKSGEGRLHGHIVLKGVNANILDVKVSGKDTDGDLAIFEQTSVSPKKGTPLHIHPRQDEMFNVLEGEYLFQVGDQRHELKKGDTIFLPRNVPHSWIQLSETGRMTVIFQPAGKMENFFLTMAALDHTPDQQEIAKIFAANEMQVVGPPVKVK